MSSAAWQPRDGGAGGYTAGGGAAAKPSAAIRQVYGSTAYDDATVAGSGGVGANGNGSPAYHEPAQEMYQNYNAAMASVSVNMTPQPLHTGYGRRPLTAAPAVDDVVGAAAAAAAGEALYGATIGTGEETYGATIGPTPPTKAANASQEIYGATIMPPKSAQQPLAGERESKTYTNSAAERAAEVLAATGGGIPAGRYKNVLGTPLTGDAAAAAAATVASHDDLAALAEAGNLSAPGASARKAPMAYEVPLQQYAVEPQLNAAAAADGVLGGGGGGGGGEGEKTLDSVELARLEFVLGMPNVDRAEAKRLLEDDGGEDGAYVFVRFSLAPPRPPALSLLE